MSINRAAFYANAKAALFGGKLTQEQVTGMEAILNNWELKLWGDDKRKLAYMLATVFHECAQKMQPITEYGSPSYFKKYEAGTEIGKRLGNKMAGDGFKYRGRGFVQLTGRANYQKAGTKLCVDFISQPDKVLELPYSTQIMFNGMSEGWFTGRKLSQYFNDTTCDWVSARKIINGLDCADKIAGYGKKFYQALEMSKQIA